MENVFAGTTGFFSSINSLVFLTLLIVVIYAILKFTAKYADKSNENYEKVNNFQNNKWKKG